MTILETIILSIIEGITEFLPVSSTGHLSLGAEVLGINDPSFMASFIIAIQAGAILAVVVLYARKLFTQPALWGRLVIAMIPTALVAVTLYSFIKDLLSNSLVIILAIGIGGVIMIAVEYWLARNKRPMEKEKLSEETTNTKLPTYKNSFIIGLYQVIAFIPGVSRSASTIIGGLIHGVGRRTVVEFSFLLAVPTMLAATGYDLLQSGGAFSVDQWHILVIGCVISFVIAIASIKFLLAYIKRYSFIAFGIYRIIFALVLFFVLV